MPRFACAGAVVFLALLVAGCEGDGTSPRPGQETSCTEEGVAHSGVSVNSMLLLAQHHGVPMSVRTCVQGRCSDRRYSGASQRHVSAGISGFHVPSSRRVEVRVTVVSRGETFFDAKTTVQLHRGYVNGKGCPPTTWFARVSTHGTDVLRQDQVAFDKL